MKLSVLRAGSAPSRAGLAVGMLPAELVGEAQAAAGWSGPGLLESFFDSARPTGLSYWDLHGGLLVPTVWLLTAGMPSLLRSSSEGSSKLTRTASFAFLGFILTIAVLQAFVWDSVGAEIGIWQFNPEKTTGLGASTLLPLEEVLWLFHHVIKAALWQLKIADFDLAKPGAPPAPLPAAAMAGGNAALAALAVGGAAALLGEYDSAKCVGLVAAFFAPVLAICFNLGTRYLRSHWRLFAAGWLAPGLWTVAIDCVGQQQGVWNFPGQYLTGISTLPDGLLKLDIAAVYLVSTLAVTATGAIILAAGDEFAARRAAAGEVGEATLWDFGLFLFEGALGPEVRRQMERVRPAGVEWSYEDAASPQPAVVE